MEVSMGLHPEGAAITGKGLNAEFVAALRTASHNSRGI
jgi:hypothetical protein